MNNNKKGFTLAEVLITLTIIGVVAALTIPSLLSDISDKSYEAKRQGLRTRMAQAISQIDALNSYEDPDDPAKNSSMKFVVDALSKVYKIKSICDFSSFSACDFPAEFGRFFAGGHWVTRNYSTLSGITVNRANATTLGATPSTAAVIKSVNGESMLVYYNPACVAEQDVDPVTNEKIFAKELCVFILYDLDGSKKGPNVYGRDMGNLAVFYADTPYVVMPHPTITWGNLYNITMPLYSATAGTMTAESYCSNYTDDGYTAGDLTLPSREELYAHSFVSSIAEVYGTWNWSSTMEGAGPDDYAWMVSRSTLKAKLSPKNIAVNPLCQQSK